MIRDIELIFEKDSQQLKLNAVDRLSQTRRKANPRRPSDDFDCIICQDKETKRYFFVPVLQENKQDIEDLKKDIDQFIVYEITYSRFKRLKEINAFSARPIIDASNIETSVGAQVSDGTWQTACALTAEVGESNQHAYTGFQFAFPVGLSLIAGAIRGYRACSEYEKKYGHPVPEEIKKSIVKDSAAFAAKTAVAMGAWELGFFVGQCIITACSTTPFTFWVPVMLSICAGFFQGIAAVTSTLADEKRKFGEVRSSTFDLAVTFLTNFVSGAAWQVCSYIPFGSLLAKSVLKPAAEVLGTVLVGAATAISSFLINTLFPKVLNYFAPTPQKKSKKSLPENPRPASPTASPQSKSSEQSSTSCNSNEPSSPSSKRSTVFLHKILAVDDPTNTAPQSPTSDTHAPNSPTASVSVADTRPQDNATSEMSRSTSPHPAHENSENHTPKRARKSK